MNAVADRTGGCLCGEVRYAVGCELRPVLHCHCENCRRITGNFMAATGSMDEALQILDAESQLRWYELGYARYGFCGRCGSTLFWQAEDRPGYTVIAAGTLDGEVNLDLEAVWFAAEAHSYNRMPDDVPTFEGNNEDSDPR